MSGYFDNYEKPELTVEAFLKEDYQQEYEAWLDNSVMPRNAYIKLYNQLQYSLFDLNKDVIGRNGSIFGEEWIKCELCMNGYDFSKPETSAAMDEFVGTLSEVNDKLDKFGKKLMVYTTPAKAHWYLEDVPERYKVQAVNGIRGIDYFREKISQTNIKYLDTDLIIAEVYTQAFSQRAYIGLVLLRKKQA